MRKRKLKVELLKRKVEKCEKNFRIKVEENKELNLLKFKLHQNSFNKKS